jgi:single-strand DNA-binding protein
VLRIFALSNRNRVLAEIKIINRNAFIEAMHKPKNMYALKNKVQLIGNLGNAPEVRNTEAGKKLVRFSVATNEQYKNAKGERVTETQWHNLIAWGKVADIAEKFLVKGTEVAIEGKLINRNYMDKEGNKKYITEIQVTELLLLGKATNEMVA